MFIFSVRSPKFKKIAAVAAVILAGIILFCALKGCGAASGEECSSGREASIDMAAADAAGRLKFIKSLGWTVDEKSAEVCEVLIPAEFDEVYSEYNKIQSAQGTDLTPYAGEKVKKWTYDVTNYDGCAPDSGCIKLNLLILDGKVIGGDVCSVELDGFMQSFYKN